jgi:hypothetical protein
MGGQDEGDRAAAVLDRHGRRQGDRPAHERLRHSRRRLRHCPISCGWKLNLQSAPYAGGTKAPNSKVKFSCPACEQNAWGKPDLAIVCELCERKMRAVENPK